MSRAVEPWVGKTDDAKVPPRVRIRVFEREGGRCWISGRKIMPGEKWELDHKVALINGGRHSEDNLAPALVAPHRQKTAEDVSIKSKTARMRAKHLGQWPKSPFKIKSRGFPKRRAQQEPR
jgi:5-methylcytosine-specific restriction endonuclease McrA